MSREHYTHTVGTISERSSLAQQRLTKREFARRLYQLMTEKKMRQSELARAADLPRDSISRYIRQVSLPEPLNLAKLAKVFGMAPEDLLPNYLTQAIELESDLPSDSPLLVEQSPTDPTLSRLRINKLVKTSALPKILQALHEGSAECVD